MKKYIKLLIPILVGIVVLICGIVTKARMLTMMPVFVSLFVMLYQSQANRYGYLAGGLNCLIYTVVYLYTGLYASAFSTLLISCPVQIITFFRWNKRPYKNSVVFKRMPWKGRTLVALIFAFAWGVCYYVLRMVGSDYALLDITATLMGITVSILTALAYIEYSYLWICSITLTLALSVQVMLNSPGYITHVIYAAYSAVCVFIAFFNVRKLYKQQNS